MIRPLPQCLDGRVRQPCLCRCCRHSYVEYSSSGTPAFVNTEHNWFTNCAFINATPSMELKNTPGWVPHLTTYDSTARTGQRSSPVAPRNTSVPLPNWSIFDHFRNTLSTCPFSLIATSPQKRRQMDQMPPPRRL